MKKIKLRQFFKEEIQDIIAHWRVNQGENKENVFNKVGEAIAIYVCKLLVKKILTTDLELILLRWREWYGFKLRV